MGRYESALSPRERIKKTESIFRRILILQCCMRQLQVATGNAHKLSEIRSLLGPEWEVVGLSDLGIEEDIPETENTLEGNALLKARYLYERTGQAVCAEDTGLEIRALGGEPGVRSARYAGDARRSDANMDLVLSRMRGISDRSARFRTVIAFLDDSGRSHLFEGVCEGSLREQRAGTGGFGYDPIFQPEGYTQTFAELSTDQKNAISHRGRAVRAFIDFLIV